MKRTPRKSGAEGSGVGARQGPTRYRSRRNLGAPVLNVSVFGLGYVGAVSCGCLAELGHTVIGVDVVQAKVDLIAAGRSPVTEEGLTDLLTRNVRARRLRATSDPKLAVAESNLAIICVGTPSTTTGAVNTEFMEAVCRQIGTALNTHGPEFFVVINRSTCLPHIHHRLQEILAEASGRRIGNDLGYVCHPEFLREGVGLADFYEPAKIIFGASDPRSEETCRRLYPGIDAPTFFVSPDVAAMAKYADNCFHAVKVTFANEMGMICKELNVDSRAVMDLLCRDTKLNLSAKYLKPGPAFGGSCLPKDLSAVLDAARATASPLPMFAAAMESNRLQLQRLLDRVVGPDRPSVGIVGLAFKEATDDVRLSPMVAVVEHLCGKGHAVLIYDACLSVPSLIGANRSFALSAIPHLADLLCSDLQGMIDSVDVVLVSHRLSPQVWQKITFKSGQRVLDLADVPELRRAPNYEGLYW